MNNYRSSVKKVYSELEDIIILGLTGRTGSGCSTVAEILSTQKFGELALTKPKHSEFKDLEERKYTIVHRFMSKNWKPFTTIEVSSIIISFIVEQNFKDFKDFIQKLSQENKSLKFRIGGEDELLKRLDGLESFFGKNECCNFDEYEVEKYYEFYTKTVKKYKESFFNILKDYSCYENNKSHFHNSQEKKSNLYTYLLQLIGNNIRSSGNPYKSEFNSDNFYKLSERICNIIDVIKKYNENKRNETKGRTDGKTRICIDALRNPYEIFYLKDRYTNFYLLSVSTEDIERRRRLSYLDSNELISLDMMEYPTKDQDGGEVFFQQSISDCVQIADIHLYNEKVNNRKYKLLTKKLVRYISLMLHPGLVTPTDEERCMQIAYNTRFNSGCLSRQVGSVITDENFCVKAVGWNDVPHGQVPCSLRNIPDYVSEADGDSFSEFELTDKTFSKVMGKLNEEYENASNLSEYNLPFCFKDIYNGIKNDKNQVHTRALHAEENAFLQISKHGGQGIKGGKLFVTASPCELCSKKSYQLGIREIYYIDPYPGISSAHVLNSGKADCKPELKLFYGAIGNAYIHLYTQRFSYKDELQLVSGVNVKNVARNKELRNNKQEYNDIKYISTDIELVFKTRHEIEFYQDVSIKFKRDGISQLRKNLSWSGSSYDKTVINEETDKYTVSDGVFSDGEIYYIVRKKNKAEFKKDETFSYKVKTFVRDEREVMNPVLYHYVKAETEQLTMKVKFDSSKKWNITNGRVVLYADVEKNIIYKTIQLDEPKNEGDYLVYKWESDERPNLLYIYSIEWDFEKNVAKSE